MLLSQIIKKQEDLTALYWYIYVLLLYCCYMHCDIAMLPLDAGTCPYLADALMTTRRKKKNDVNKGKIDNPIIESVPCHSSAACRGSTETLPESSLEHVHV